ncbi:LTA synthase family protein [Clostridium beijerinckii]|nr:alkaline phosphatase family protein [Clostridium beijerinckii]
MNNMNDKHRIKQVKGYMYSNGIYMLLGILAAFIITYLQEYIFRSSFFEASVWIREAVSIFLLNYILILMTYIMLIFIIRNLGIAFLIEGVSIFIISVINYYKFTFKGEVLTFSDFKLINETSDIIGNYRLSITNQMVVSIIIILLCVITLSRIKIPQFKKKYTIFLIVVCISSIFMYVGYLRGGLNGIQITKTTYVAVDSYKEKGLLLGMIREIKPDIQKPSDYTRENIDNIVKQNLDNGKSGNAQKPNIIMIMNESFYDLNLLNHVSLSQDTIPNFREYQKQFGEIKLLSPVFGGNTCQTEYEVLTGYPVSNTEDRMAYNELITKNIDSMVSVLNNEGYYTFAMHPNIKTFFNRGEVYKKMGFDEMKFSDSMKDITTEGNYPSDKYTYNQLIDSYKNKEEGKPFFAHIVTMQNHGGYDYAYDKYNIKVLNNNLGEDGTRQLQTYANLEKESDESLKYLIDYFSNIKEPTIIVFYGDHAPGVQQFNISYPDESDPEKQKKIIIDQHTTPALIWNNMGLEKKDYGYVSAYKLGALVLERAKLNDVFYFNFVSNNVLSGTNGIYAEEDKFLYKDELEENQLDNLHKMWLLQYDRMFGDKFSLGGNK